MGIFTFCLCLPLCFLMVEMVAALYGHLFPPWWGYTHKTKGKNGWNGQKETARDKARGSVVYWGEHAGQYFLAGMSISLPRAAVYLSTYTRQRVRTATHEIKKKKKRVSWEFNVIGGKNLHCVSNDPPAHHPGFDVVVFVVNIYIPTTFLESTRTQPKRFIVFLFFFFP